MIFGDTAPSYWKAGLQVIPLIAGMKRPLLDGWQAYCAKSVDAETQAEWLSRYGEYNIGVALGPASDLVAVDIDATDPAVVAALRAALPTSPWERVGSKGVMLVYKYSGEKTFRIKNTDGVMVVECLSKGTQCVVPPSIHPDTGKPYHSNADLWSVRQQIVALPQNLEAVLRTALEKSGVTLSPKATAGRRVRIEDMSGTIGPGGRDDAATRYVGMLSKQVVQGKLNYYEALTELEAWFIKTIVGGNAPSIDKFVEKLSEFFHADTEQRDKSGAVVMDDVPAGVDTDGKPVYRPRLMAPYGWDDGLTDQEKSRHQLWDIHTGLAERYIANHYVLSVKTGVFINKQDGSAQTSDEIINRFGSYIKFHPQTKKQMDTVKNERSLQRVDYSAVRPEKALSIIDEPPYKVWNAWRGWPVPAARGVTDGDVALFLELVSALVPNEVDRGHLLDWIAFQVQHPGRKIKWAVWLLSREQGTGKSTLAETIMRLFDRRHVEEISTRDLVSDFNDWIVDKLIVFIDELASSHRLDTLNTLKPLITSDRVQVNRKGLHREATVNLANFVVASNAKNAIPIDETDRRFMVIEPPPGVVAQLGFVFFKAYRACLDDLVFRAKLLGWLQGRDLSAFNPDGHAPLTEGKQRVIALNRPKDTGYLDEALDGATGPFYRDLVLISEVVEYAWASRHLQISEKKVCEWIKSRGGVALSRRRVHSVSLGDKQGSPWIVRNAARWVAADRDEVLAEIARLPSGGGRLAELARAAESVMESAEAAAQGSDHIKRNAKVTCPPAQGAKLPRKTTL